MNVTRRTHVLLAAALAVAAALGLVTAGPPAAPEPTLVAGGSGHCC
ncbi:hypothetical protein [Longivirga aurantiaca]|uniref:Uncharacterized protein n=1 Tax=Longivirga aurantiaca TaxID=1837743 RepID=A0ABW1T4N9_9ACTN